MYNSIVRNHAQATVPVIDQPDENVTNGADPIGNGAVQFGPAITAGLTQAFVSLADAMNAPDNAQAQYGEAELEMAEGLVAQPSGPLMAPPVMAHFVAPAPVWMPA